MQCPKCGNERRPEDATCRYCGAALTTQRAGRAKSPIRVLFPIGLLVVLVVSFLTLGPLRQIGSRSEPDANNAGPVQYTAVVRQLPAPAAVEPRQSGAADPGAASTPAPAPNAPERRPETSSAPRRDAVPPSAPTPKPAATPSRENTRQPARQSRGEGGPVRVGGEIKPPRKTHDVSPVYPPTAIAARIQGIVIIEANIAPDGEVTDARVIRSVPLLDQAAVDAVLQWTYEPTFLNGVAVPVIMTVTVNFALK